MVKLDFSNNWWGTEDLASIEDQVLDGIDNPDEKAYVIVEPFLTEATSTDATRPSGP